MDAKLKQDFLERWQRYFPGAELPLTFFYTDALDGAEHQQPALTSRCLICDLARARSGTALAFDARSAMCSGGLRYLGFVTQLRPNFEYFLSCGIPDKLEGERYKKTPELVRELLEHAPKFAAPAKYAVFKRWDLLEPGDEPAVVIFFATPDVLSGLFTLSGFEVAETQSVIAPFSAGCGSIVQYPYLELSREQPRAVLGMFDVSARPCVPAGTLSFAVPLPKFARMVADMDESFLITESWEKVRRRIAGQPADAS